LVALSLAMLLSAQVSVLDAGEREFFALISDAPSEVTHHVTGAFHRHTDLAPILIAAEAIEGCSGSPVCLVLRVRAELSKRNASFLAVMSTSAGRTSAVLIDLDEALRCADGGGDDEAIAQCATDRALLATRLPEQIGEASAWVEALVGETFRPALEKAGHWEPYGSIDMTIDRSDALVSLDGKPLGRATGNARIESVRPGARKVELEHPEAQPFEAALEVRRGQVASIDVVLESNAGTHLARTLTLWSGVGIGAIGIGLSIWAAVASASARDHYCVGDECSGSDFSTIGDLTRTGDRLGRPEGGVLALPLGYSIAGAGAAFSLGALFIGEDEELPWIAWLVGVGVGGLAYGISAAVD
jgi:hypothetical protein